MKKHLHIEDTPWEWESQVFPVGMVLDHIRDFLIYKVDVKYDLFHQGHSVTFYKEENGKKIPVRGVVGFPLGTIYIHRYFGLYN